LRFEWKDGVLLVYKPDSAVLAGFDVEAFLYIGGMPGCINARGGEDSGPYSSEK